MWAPRADCIPGSRLRPAPDCSPAGAWLAHHPPPLHHMPSLDFKNQLPLITYFLGWLLPESLLFFFFFLKDAFFKMPGFIPGGSHFRVLGWGCPRVTQMFSQDWEPLVEPLSCP